MLPLVEGIILTVALSTFATILYFAVCDLRNPNPYDEE